MPSCHELDHIVLKKKLKKNWRVKDKQTVKKANFGQCAIRKAYITWSFSSGELKECWIKQMSYDWLHWFCNVMWSCRNVKLMSLLPLDFPDP